eukprot:gene16471-20147_t
MALAVLAAGMLMQPDAAPPQLENVPGITPGERENKASGVFHSGGCLPLGLPRARTWYPHAARGEAWPRSGPRRAEQRRAKGGGCWVDPAPLRRLSDDGAGCAKGGAVRARRASALLAMLAAPTGRVDPTHGAAAVRWGAAWCRRRVDPAPAQECGSDAGRVRKEAMRIRQTAMPHLALAEAGGRVDPTPGAEAAVRRNAAAGGWVDPAPRRVRWEGGHRGERVGEARHPGKSGLCVMTANVSSLPVYEAVVTGFDADVVALQETKLTAMGQRQMGKALDLAGWTAHWGPPRPKKAAAATQWNAAHGGVGVLVKKGIPAQVCVPSARDSP